MYSLQPYILRVSPFENDNLTWFLSLSEQPSSALFTTVIISCRRLDLLFEKPLLCPLVCQYPNNCRPEKLRNRPLFYW